MRKRIDDSNSNIKGLRVLVTVDEAAALLCVGRWTIYQLLARNELPGIKLGRMRRSPLHELSAFIQRQIELED